MKLMTKELGKTIPRLYSQENDPDPIVYAKFFTPWTFWTWYVMEWDGEDICFGYVVGLEKELGYFSLKELKEIKGPGGLKIERDIYFKPLRLSEVKEKEGDIM